MTETPSGPPPELITGKALQRRRWKALGIGCGVLVAVPIVLIAAIAVTGSVQLGRIQRKADAIRPGMPAAEAVVKAGDWFVFWITTGGKAGPDYKIQPSGTGGYIVTDLTAFSETTCKNQAELLQAFAKAIATGHSWKLQFRYVTLFPRQVQFIVELDQQNRVAK